MVALPRTMRAAVSRPRTDGKGGHRTARAPLSGGNPDAGLGLGLRWGVGVGCLLACLLTRYTLKLLRLPMDDATLKNLSLTGAVGRPRQQTCAGAGAGAEIRARARVCVCVCVCVCES